ncbi:uncharacterized protein B4U80_12431, partial [Leptotrombidium deliense]
VQKLVENTIAKCDYCSIVIDGWTNVSNKNIHNIIICTPLPVFHSSVECDAAKQDSKYLMTLLEPVIADIGPEKVTSIVTDNEAKMKKLGFLVNKKHAHIFHTGCAAHAINLIAKDIARIDSIATLLKLLNSLVETIKKSSKLSQILRKNGKIVKGTTKGNKNPVVLRLYSKTRFYGIGDMLSSVLSNREALLLCTSDDEFIVDNDAKKMILDMDFWERVTHLKRVFEPITEAIAVVEADECSIAAIPEIFEDLYQALGPHS